MTLQDQDGKVVLLADEPLDKGGEGKIFEVVGESHLVAKIYHLNNQADKADKLKAMLAAPPEGVSSGLGHFSICWPSSMLYESGGGCVGFLMPRVDTLKYHKLFCLYHFYDRQSAFPAFTWDNLLHAGRNLAFILSSLHSRGYVIGDVNESNFLVSERALVTIVDCDSMQVRGPGRIFPCGVGKDEYIAPELYYNRSAVRRADQDNFSLAILLFLMLMEGFGPFDGIGDESPPEELILNGNTPYVLPSKVTAKPNAPPFAMLPEALQALFVRAFGKGHKDPTVRPTSEEFYRALAAVKVTRCEVEHRHLYPEHNTKCPWCERATLLGIDTFATAEPVQPLAPPIMQPQTQRQSSLPAAARVQSPPQPAPPPVGTLPVTLAGGGVGITQARKVSRGWAIALGWIAGFVFLEFIVPMIATLLSPVLKPIAGFGWLGLLWSLSCTVCFGVFITSVLNSKTKRAAGAAILAAVATLVTAFVLVVFAQPGAPRAPTQPVAGASRRR